MINTISFNGIGFRQKYCDNSITKMFSMTIGNIGVTLMYVIDAFKIQHFFNQINYESFDQISLIGIFILFLLNRLILLSVVQLQAGKWNGNNSVFSVRQQI